MRIEKTRREHKWVSKFCNSMEYRSVFVALFGKTKGWFKWVVGMGDEIKTKGDCSLQEEREVRLKKNQ